MSFVNLMRQKDFTPDVSYEQVRPLMKYTYAWMFVGLLVTSVIAFLTVSMPALIELRSNRGVVFGAIIAEFVIVIALSWALPRLTTGVAALMFVAYSALNGFTLSILLLVYTSTSIIATFIATAGLFGTLSAFAFFTNLDLTRWQNFLFIGLIGLVIAMVVNTFLASTALSFLINIAGVLIFMALIAVDTQKIKRLAASPEFQADGSLVAKFSIFMALELYLDFVNLFIFLLRLMGNRR